MSEESMPRPFISLGPGYTIKKYLEARGWTQEDLAQVMDISAKQLSQVINNKVRITFDTAHLLSEAFDNSAEFWINLDTHYRLHQKAEEPGETATQRKARVRKYMPVSEIYKKGWFVGEKNADGYESLYKAITGKQEIDESPYDNAENRFCARQKKDNPEFTKAYTRTWELIARKKADEIQVPAYRQDKLKSLVSRFTDYTCGADGIKHLIEDLNDAGVKFFVLSHLTKTYLDGACFLKEGHPVIVYTARYDRFDNFWFTLAHEIAHVLLHLSAQKDQCFVDDLADTTADSEEEIEADKMAEKMLRYDEILAESQPFLNYFSEVKLNEIARKLKIEPSIIVGMLQHNGLIEYRTFNKFKKKVKHLFPAGINMG